MTCAWTLSLENINSLNGPFKVKLFKELIAVNVYNVYSWAERQKYISGIVNFLSFTLNETKIYKIKLIINNTIILYK